MSFAAEGLIGEFGKPFLGFSYVLLVRPKKVTEVANAGNNPSHSFGAFAFSTS
jgi:hypothetical protein